MSDDASYQAGDVVWAPDPFRDGANPRLWLVVASEGLPYRGEEYICVALTTSDLPATVEVGVQANGGAFGFGPPAIHVDNGATVEWDWTGEGGGHNVISAPDGPLDSGEPVSQSGVQYKYTFDEDGIFTYICEPHEGLGMKGAVVVGTDYPTTTAGSGAAKEVDPHEAGVPIQPHYVGFGAGLAVIIPLVFTFFLLKYGESPHTSGGNN